LQLHAHPARLKCPYKGCEKQFEKPTVLTDYSQIPRENYYACPYCNSKIDILVDEMKVIDIKPTEYPKVLDSPAKCAHYTGFLDSIESNTPVPDDCLICPKILQCSVKNRG